VENVVKPEPKSLFIKVSAALATVLLAGSQIVAAQSPAPSADNPEPGLSGAPIPGAPAPTIVDSIGVMGSGVLPQPYSKGVRVVGHSPTGGMQMGWIDRCAYIAGAVGPAGHGIAVVDVRNPVAPRDVRMLTDPGASQATENFDARVTSSGRKIVIGGDRAVGGTTNNASSRLSIYDASDCENPKHMAEYVWPEGTHTVHISPDGMLVYGMTIEPMTGRGGIHVLDISDLAHPRYVGKFGITGPDGRSWEFAPHNMIVSPDGRRMYVGVIGSRGGDLNRESKLADGVFGYERFAPGAGGVYIIDSSDFAAGRANPKLRLIGTAEHSGWHDTSLANIKGVPYLVGTGEGIIPCPGAFPLITNIADEQHPRIVGAFRTDMNRPENCPAASAPPKIAMTADGKVAYPTPAARAAAMNQSSKQSSHYSSVDSATNTRIGMFSMTGAGFRIADLRNPANPVEIAYFRPGPACSGFSRYVEKTGQIWMSCGAAGFYVLDLAPDVRAALQSRH
jgi:hypothetical protein